MRSTTSFCWYVRVIVLKLYAYTIQVVVLASLAQLLVFVELTRCARSVQRLKMCFACDALLCMVHLASSVADRSRPESRGGSTRLQSTVKQYRHARTTQQARRKLSRGGAAIGRDVRGRAAAESGARSAEKNLRLIFRR